MRGRCDGGAEVVIWALRYMCGNSAGRERCAEVCARAMHRRADLLLGCELVFADIRSSVL